MQWGSMQELEQFMEDHPGQLIIPAFDISQPWDRRYGFKLLNNEEDIKQERTKIMEITEQITHLLLDEGADGYHRYQVTVPARIAEEIGADDIATMRQFLDAIERWGEYAKFEVVRIDGDELAAWKRARKNGLNKQHD